MSTRCLIVDDNVGFQESARKLLEREGMHVVGVASRTEEALTRIAELQPEVVLVDIDLLDESGFDLAHTLGEQRTVQEQYTGGPAVIMISSHFEADYHELVEASPALGMVDKAELSATAIWNLLRS